MSDKETKLKQLLVKHGTGQAKLCRDILDVANHYISYHNMCLLVNGRYKSEISIKRARAFADTFNKIYNEKYTIDDIFE